MRWQRRHLSAVALAFSLTTTVNGQQQITEGYVPTPDGTRLYFQRVGRGSQTIIVPARLFLFDQIKTLGDSFTVIAYDMRNRGRSDPISDSTKLGIAADVRDLETVRAHFGVARPHLVGYSYLGMMVMLYAREHPERVNRVVQLGPVPMRWNTEYPASLVDRTPTGADSAAVRHLAAIRARRDADPREVCEAEWSVSRFGLVGDPSHVDRAGGSACDMANEWPIRLEWHFRFSFASVQRLDHSWSDFARVTNPVLTIHGTRDRNAPYGAGREWALRLPNARLLTIPGAAHQAFAERSETVLPAMRSFFLGEWPALAERVTSLLPAAPG